VVVAHRNGRDEERTVTCQAQCPCTGLADTVTGTRVLLSTRVSHTHTVLRSALADLGVAVVQRSDGLLEAGAGDPSALLTSVREQLTVIEADEVRVVVRDDGDDGDALIAAAFTAPTLTQFAARTAHADLLPLFADELNAFRSVYQPIVSLRPDDGDAVVGYEALLRATGANGQVLPDQMFAAAAESGWLHVLDRIGRTSAIRGAAGWLGDKLLFVNFVPTTIYRPEVCLRTTVQAIAQAGLSLEQLVFEVTEGEHVADLGHLSDVFAYYRQRGAKVALDDLGAGYSSLNMLVRLEPDVVKLDKDIVQGLPGRLSAAVVTAIVSMTHSYGGRVLAECIETVEQADAARELGVDLGQGWFFGRPEERQQRRQPSQAVANRAPTGLTSPEHEGIHLAAPPVPVPA
jgi:EAL domain-containing protein (putative c-di-GMP-specific phosphodiesterase class I)